MLKDLKILNGNLELEFNEYTYEYTVTVENNVNSLDIDYLLAEDSYIKIKDNILDEEENIVYLNVYNVNEEITYTLYVYKELTSEVSGIDNYKMSLLAYEKEELEVYKIQLLTVSVFLLIVLVFSILFRRKRKS